MIEHPLQFLPNPNLPPEIRARLAMVGEIAQLRADAASERRKPYNKALSARLNAIVQADLPATVKMAGLWQVADELGKFLDGDVACKRGCSHCCHIGVAVMAPEAELIGSLIGRKPATPHYYTNFGHFDYGYHNPCTFLKGGECSIYAYRPLACRLQYSMDVDDLLCRLIPPASVPVPYCDTSEMTMAQVLVCVDDRDNPRMSDIREWFPA